MILKYDKPTKELVEALRPYWSEIRAATRRFPKTDDTNM